MLHTAAKHSTDSVHQFFCYLQLILDLEIIYYTLIRYSISCSSIMIHMPITQYHWITMTGNSQNMN